MKTPLFNSSLDEAWHTEHALWKRGLTERSMYVDFGLEYLQYTQQLITEY